MTVLKRKLQSFENLLPDSTAGLTLPIGMSYHGIILKLTSTGGTFTRSHIPRVRLLINGKAVIRDIPASILHRDNLFRGSKDDAKFLFLDFEEPRSMTMEGKYATLIHTAKGVNSFKLELDISASATGTLKIETWALVSATGAELGAVPAFIKDGVDVSSSGVKEITPSFGVGENGRGHVLRCVHFVPSVSGSEVAPSTVLGSSGITLRKSGLNIIDRLQDDVNRFYQEHYEDVPITNAFTVDFVEDNNTLVHLMSTGDATDFTWEVDNSVSSVHWDIYYRMVTFLDLV